MLTEATTAKIDIYTREECWLCDFCYDLSFDD